MKSYLYYSKYFILALVLCYSEMFSASRVASVSGNWNSTATWGGQSVPVSGDNVTINTGIVVTCTANAVCDNLTLANTNGSITINTGVTLTVRGLLNCSASASSDVIGGTGTIVLTGAATSSPFLVFGNNMSASAVFNNITFDPGSGNNITVGTGNIKADALILFNSGTTTLAAGTEIRGSTGTATLTVNSGATLSLSGQIRSSSTATTFISVVNINGTLTTSNYVNATTLNIGASGVLNTSLSGTNNTQGWWYQSSSPTTVNLNSTSTVNYNAAAAQIIANAYTYGHLTTGGSGSKTLSGATTVAGSLTIGTGTTLDVTSSNYALNVAGNWSNSGTFTAQNGTVTLNGTGAQSIGGGVSTSFYNLTVNKSGGTATLGIAQTVGGNLSISSNSSLDCSTYQITGNSSGTMSMSSGSSLILGSTGSSTAVSFPTLFTSGNTSLNLSSTVTYQTN
ncbi:MAG: beta strand repeat-containing protein, partial [Bacteroidia bacterium]